MNAFTSPAHSRTRLSRRAESKVMLIVIIAVIALAAVALFFQWRGSHEVDKRAEKAGVGKIHSGPKKSGDKGTKKKKDKGGAAEATK